MIKKNQKVIVAEVGPRDGLQSFPRWISTEDKVRMLDLLSDAGLPVIEVTSFAHPKIVPMLTDAEAVLERIKRRPDTIYRALVPNKKGAIRAVESGLVDEILGLLTVSETYLKKNQNMTLDQAIDVAGDCFKIAEKANIRFVMAVGVAFFCPYQGRIEDSVALSVVKRLYEKGIRRLYLAASTGMEDPIHVGRVFKTVTDCWPDIELGFHVHERIGMASANMFAALNSGATSVEGSICGIGGGIAMPNGMGDIGNLPTEDIVNMLETSRIETGIEINSIVQAAKKIEQILDLKCRSFVGRTNSIEN
jgi:hydroxymethylglutaryl-CoA lyase|tara:strand:- start:178 stop:1095 length:918 start_codon:yes stop_codon:yes gene_type:complete